MDFCGLWQCAYEETLRGKLVLDTMMISCVVYSLTATHMCIYSSISMAALPQLLIILPWLQRIGAFTVQFSWPLFSPWLIGERGGSGIVCSVFLGDSSVCFCSIFYIFPMPSTWRPIGWFLLSFTWLYVFLCHDTRWIIFTPSFFHAQRFSYSI